jgi:hypothetical protein
MRIQLCALSLVASLAACATEEEVSQDDANWEAESALDETKSTHLWIVNSAVSILGKHSELAPAKAILSSMKDATCKAQWQQGLLDADYKGKYNNGRLDLEPGSGTLKIFFAGSTWESHFYDPDTGKNYKGTPKTSFTESMAHLKSAKQLYSTTGKRDEACYELGLALHYFTDLTQPMHVTNFTAVNKPAKLHSNLEGYSMEVQERFRVQDWSGVPSATHEEVSASAFFIKTARDSKALWLPGVEAVIHAYARKNEENPLKCRPLDLNPLRFIETQKIDYKECWEGDAEVDAAVGRSLQLAQDRTAQFLYVLGGMIVDATSTK